MTSASVPVFVIVGGGASGTLLALHLRNANVQARIIILDPAEKPALGLAYSTSCPQHLLNVRNCSMSAFPEDPDHFLRWLRETVDVGAAPHNFSPRMIFGQYLRQCWHDAEPEHWQVRATDCYREDGQWHLDLDDGRVLLADVVILAQGNFDPAALRNVEPRAQAEGVYEHNAWQQVLYDETGAEMSVVLAGTGLTAVDVVVKLRESGHRGKITALSRHGWPPQAHLSQSTPCVPPIVDAQMLLTAVGCLKAFKKAVRGGMPWRTAVDSLRCVSNRIWLSMPVVERQRFRRHLQRRWDIARHRIAPEVAALLESEIREGRLVFARGHVHSVGLQGKCAEVTVGTSEGMKVLQADRVVNCTGPHRDYLKVGSPLLKNMLERGDLRQSVLGGGLECLEDGALTDVRGDTHGDIFAIGPMRIGTLFESVAIPEIRDQAAALADLLAKRAT